MLTEFRPNVTEVTWSPTNVVKMVTVGCISRSQGNKKFLIRLCSKNIPKRPSSFIFGV